MPEETRYPKVVDSRIRELLVKIFDEPEPGAQAEIYTHFRQRFSAVIHPNKEPLPPQEGATQPQPAPEQTPTTLEQTDTARWEKLADDIRETAQYFIDCGLCEWKNSQAKRGGVFRRTPDFHKGDRKLSVLARDAQSLLLLWVEAHFYANRAFLNENAAKQAPQEQREKLVVARFQQYLEGYRRVLAEWRQTVFSVTGKRFFKVKTETANQILAWRHMFGSVTQQYEPGYNIFANAIGRELRLQYYQAAGKERRNPLIKMGFFLVRLTFQPVRFALAVGLIALLFTILYTVNDAVSFSVWRTQGSAPFPSLSDPSAVAQYLGLHLFQAITNLVTLGSYTAPPGMYTPVLLSVESVTGYFILAMLASSFFQRLQDT